MDGGAFQSVLNVNFFITSQVGWGGEGGATGMGGAKWDVWGWF